MLQSAIDIASLAGDLIPEEERADFDEAAVSSQLLVLATYAQHAGNLATRDRVLAARSSLASSSENAK
jgi:hypothetical protein